MTAKDAVGTKRTGLILRTVAAMILAMAVFLVVATIASMFAYFTYDLRSLIPHIVLFFANIIGALVGIYAAKQACDAVLRGYSGRTICILFWGLSGLSLVVAIVHTAVTGLNWQDSVSAVQALSIAFAATMFWEGVWG
jgi:hypothetical protein